MEKPNRLENMQREILRYALEHNGVLCETDDIGVQSAYDFLIECGYIGQNEEYYPDSAEGRWIITELGRAKLEEEERICEQERTASKREKVKSVRDWITIAIAGIALIVSILALVLK